MIELVVTHRISVLLTSAHHQLQDDKGEVALMLPHQLQHGHFFPSLLLGGTKGSSSKQTDYDNR